MRARRSAEQQPPRAYARAVPLSNALSRRLAPHIRDEEVASVELRPLRTRDLPEALASIAVAASHIRDQPGAPVELQPLVRRNVPEATALIAVTASRVDRTQHDNV